MKRVLVIVGSTALVACSPAVWRPLSTTEAATELTQVTRSSANEFNPAVSPDARSVAYEAASSPDAAPRIEVMSLDGVDAGKSGRIEYTSGDVIGIEPTWKPDGTGLFFLSASPRGRSLMELTSHGSGGDPFVGQDDAFDGRGDPFVGQDDAFDGRGDPFVGQDDAFHAPEDPLVGQDDACHGPKDRFAGQDDARNRPGDPFVGRDDPCEPLEDASCRAAAFDAARRRTTRSQTRHSGGARTPARLASGP
jgi:hypothetical protein